jgi:hypothetical protein
VAGPSVFPPLYPDIATIVPLCSSFDGPISSDVVILRCIFMDFGYHMPSRPPVGMKLPVEQGSIELVAKHT